MTKIEIDLCDADLFESDNIIHKCVKAYKEAKAKEIKEGYWVIDDRDVFQAEHQHTKEGWKHLKKLPQNLQDGLNEFINR